MDGISVTANVAAVISIADVAIRASTSLINLVGAIKDTTPEKVESLTDEIRYLGNTIVRIRTTIAAAGPPGSAKPYDTQSLDELGQALVGCQETLGRLHRALEKVLASSRNVKFVSQMKWRLGCALLLSGQKIDDMCREVERRKTTLLVLFATMARGDALAIHSQLSKMRLESQYALQSCLLNNTLLQTQTVSLNKALATIDQRQIDFQSHFDQRLDQVLGIITTAKSSTGIATIEPDVYDLVARQGIDPQVQLLPPFLALQGLVETELALSGRLQVLIAEEMDTIRRSITTLCATTKNAELPSREGVILPTTRALRQASSIHTRHLSDIISGIDGTNSVTNKVVQWQRHTIRHKAADGLLRVLDILHRTPGRQGTEEHIVFMKCTTDSTTSETGVRIRSYGISILFQVLHSHLLAGINSIYRNMRPYLVQPSTAEVFVCVKQGNITVLDALFRSGSASVLDHDEEGYGLLAYAAVFDQPELYEHLLTCGADPNEVYSARGDTAISLGWYFTCTPLPQTDQDILGVSTFDVSRDARYRRAASCRRITTASIHSGSLELEIMGPSLAYQSRLWVPDQLFIEGSSFFIQSGLGVDGRDGGELLLIVVCTTVSGGVSPLVVEFLLGKGAGLTSVDRYSRGVLELYFLSLVKAEPWVSSRAVSVREFDDTTVLISSGDHGGEADSKSRFCGGRELATGADLADERLAKSTGYTATTIDDMAANGHRGKIAPYKGCSESGLNPSLPEELSWEHLCPVADFDSGNRKTEEEFRNRLALLISLLRHGADPNQKIISSTGTTHDRCARNTLTISEYIWSLEAPGLWWIWATALAECGYSFDSSGSAFNVIKSNSKGYCSKSILEREYTFLLYRDSL